MFRRLAMGIAVGCLGSVVLLAAPASAHAELVGIDPADGSIHPTMPGKAKLEFDDPIETADVTLTTSANEVGKLAVAIEGTSVIAKLPDGGPRGKYRLAYRVVSSDGHVVTGTVEFTIVEGEEPRGEVTSTPPKAYPVSRAAIIAGAALVLLTAGALVIKARR